jgi:hypothetical protein
MARRALDLVDSLHNDRYEAALAMDDGEEPATADPDGLRRFLEGEVLPWFETRKKANRPMIRQQAFGEAFDLNKLDRFGRYEVHLDRKLERMLALLKDLRQGTAEG